MFSIISSVSALVVKTLTINDQKLNFNIGIIETQIIINTFII